MKASVDQLLKNHISPKTTGVTRALWRLIAVPTFIEDLLFCAQGALKTPAWIQAVLTFF
jgi:hypothetical protein